MQEDDMPLLQVRDCPEDIYKKITIVARKQNRTIAQQVVVLLEKSLGQEEPNIERRKQLLNKIKSFEIPKEVKEIDGVAFIREDRSR
jgi:predicted nuclease of restriction endonuclease-like RecB superfamily